MTPPTPTNPNPLQDFYLRNESFLLKGAPLFIGFMIFFLYFTQNRFFPAVDLFGLASLMLSAFLIGSVFVLVAALGLWYPGWFWIDSTLRDKALRLKLWKTKPAALTDSHYEARLILAHWCLPFALTAIGSAIAATFIADAIYWALAALSFTLAASVYFSWRLLRRFELTKVEAWEQGFVLLVAQAFSLLVYIWIAWLLTGEFRAGHVENPLRAANGSAALLTILVICGYALSSLAVWQYAVAARAVLVVALAIPTGLLSHLPPQVMKWLGAGNYQAQAVLLAEEQCKKLSDAFPSIQHCTLRNVHVVWGLGDTLKLRVALQDFKDDGARRFCRSCTPEQPCEQDLLVNRDAISSILTE